MRRSVVVLMLVACTPSAVDTPYGDGDAARTVFDVAGGFLDAPFPSDHRVRNDTRRVDLSGFPGVDGAPLVPQLVALLDDQVQGWSLTGGVLVPVDAAIDATRLPDLAGSVEEGASVYLIDVDPDSPDLGRRHPIEVTAREGDGVTTPAHAVAALPLAGLPLAPRTRYALVVTRDVFDAAQRSLAPSAALSRLLDGGRPRGWRLDVTEQYLDAIDVLGEQGVALDRVAGLTVFTTGRPTRDLPTLLETGLGLGGMRILATPARVEPLHDDYCTYEGTFDVPNFQSGEPPFRDGGGTFELDADGVPKTFTDDSCGGSRTPGRACGHLTVTIPRNAGLPEAFPVVVFVKTGADGAQPVLDRGPRTTPGVDVPGTGYAATFARQGWASVQIDGPLEGPLRDPTGSGRFTFDLANPGALRDGLRQAAVELAQLPDLLDRVFVRTTTCPGIPESPSQLYLRLASDDLVVVGHDLGATVAMLAASVQPRYRGVVLSGAGGSWRDTVLTRTSPAPLLPDVAGRLGVDVATLDPAHPALQLLGWVGEPADASLVAPLLAKRDDPDAQPHVLMIQGVVDPVTPPPSSNAVALGLGLELAGASLDVTLDPGFRSLASMLPYTGGRELPLPGGLNVAAGPERNVTRVVVQHAADGIESGHEVLFQEAWPHHQVACFLQGVAIDRPVVADEGDEGAPCPLPPEP